MTKWILTYNSEGKKIYNLKRRESKPGNYSEMDNWKKPGGDTIKRIES